MTIQTIIDKFDKEFGGEEKHLSDYYVNDVKQFLKDSLTSMLDGIEEKIPEEEKITESLKGLLSYDYLLGSKEGKNEYRQEVINIINSHR